MLAICSRSVSRSRSALKILSSKFKEIKLNKSNKNLGDNNLINFIKDSEVIIVGIDKIDKKLLDHCPKLKLIGKYGVGTNNIDFNELKKRKIRILLRNFLPLSITSSSSPPRLYCLLLFFLIFPLLISSLSAAQRPRLFRRPSLSTLTLCLFGRVRILRTRRRLDRRRSAKEYLHLYTAR